MLLPHGYDGQGPEHSSARIERFLQMCDEDDNYPENSDTRAKRMERTSMQVVNCSTAANYFHLLRRQMRRDYRKPLVVISPKRLLRLKEACSNIEDFNEGLQFERVLPDMNLKLVDKSKVRRVVLCSG